EFGAVFVAGCERGLLPLWLPGAGARQADGGSGAGDPAARHSRPDPDPAEERRLLFVGMTRARTHLFLASAARRRRHGTVITAGPSPFLAAISQTLLSRASPPKPRRPADRQLRLL
ncbi:MAG TPA: 3'-5' exonuclease, partial [Streptosporangiaceae bacterium]